RRSERGNSAPTATSIRARSPRGSSGWRVSQKRSAEHMWKIVFFRSPADFRNWLKKNHASATELWVGLYKRSSGRTSIPWPESVDEALCVGWIDGIRKSVDDISYKIRFTPRKAGSIWSAVNIKRAQALVEEGRMQPPGLKAFQARKENKSGIYSYEQRRDQLEE